MIFKGTLTVKKQIDYSIGDMVAFDYDWLDINLENEVGFMWSSELDNCFWNQVPDLMDTDNKVGVFELRFNFDTGKNNDNFYLEIWRD